MRPRNWLVATALLVAGQRLTAQSSAALAEGYLLEQSSDWTGAAAAYRRALHEGNSQAALLGLERVYGQEGQTDSLLPLLDTLILQRPRDGIIRAVQLRALRMLGHADMEAAAFERWVRDSPRDPVPYREYARLLLDEGRARTADSVLDRAQRALGSGREFILETAQLRATLGLWLPAARAWRSALDTSGDYAATAAYSLRPTPDSARASVRAVLSAPPITLGSRRALANLELTWGSARLGWAALRVLPPNGAAAAQWFDFGEAAEDAGDWLVARDAFVAVLNAHVPNGPPGADLAARAASAAMHGGDAESAAALADQAMRQMDSLTAARTILGVRVRALASVGRADDAERVARAYAHWLDAAGRTQLRREIVWGYVRSGDLPRARSAIGAGDSIGDDRELTGWLALYAGDLKTARSALRQAGAPTPDLVTALALLARTQADSAPVVGRAFVQLVRGDTTAAAASFVEASDVVRDAAPLLLATAARLHTARHEDRLAMPLWRTVVERYADAPEAAEADLELGRALSRGHDVAGAITRWEHLILSYPESALVPQARHELDLARATPATS
jgi:tetratricopeptide (TPR) repeat protein